MDMISRDTEISLNGDVRTLREWCAVYNITPDSVFRRLGAGMDVMTAITLPKKNSGGAGKPRPSRQKGAYGTLPDDVDLAPVEVIDHPAPTKLTASAAHVVHFDGDALDVVQVGGDVFVSTRRVCQAVGIDPDTQRTKIEALPYARTVLATVHDTSGRTQEMHCIDLQTLSGWLFTIDHRRVAEHARDKLIRYQREAARVLERHFFPTPVQTPALPSAVQEAQGWCDLIDRHFTNLSPESRAAAKAAVLRDKLGATAKHLLPVVEERWYSVTDVADFFGVSGNLAGKSRKRVGLEGNRDGLCSVRLSQSPHSSKQVEQTLLSPRAAAMVGRDLVSEDRITETVFREACQEHGLPCM